MPTTTLTWQNLTNGIINGDGDFEKNAGFDHCAVNDSGTGDAGARSVQTITAGPNWEFAITLGPVGGLSGRSFVGLKHGSFSVDYALWDYCFHVSTVANTSGTPHPANSIFVYEGGPPNRTYRDGLWTNSGQLLRFVCTNNVVRYYLDSLMVYESPVAPVYPLFAVISLACMNKVAKNPYFVTGLANTGVRGSDTGDACAMPWTLTTPAVFPLPDQGGPQHAYFAELAGDWGEFGQDFPDGKPNFNTIQTAPVRLFRCEWQGLTKAQATALDAHYASTKGGLEFTMTHPYTAEVLPVRYLKYGRTNHEKEWSQDRQADLISYTN